MKIRQGFISNSSTSSFIIKGFMVDLTKTNYKTIEDILKSFYIDFRVANPEDMDEIDLKYEFQRYLRDNSIIFTDYVEDGSPNDTTAIFGELIYDNDIYELPDMQVDLNVSEMTLEIKEKIENTINQELPLKLIIGTRCC